MKSQGKASFRLVIAFVRAGFIEGGIAPIPGVGSCPRVKSPSSCLGYWVESLHACDKEGGPTPDQMEETVS